MDRNTLRLSVLCLSLALLLLLSACASKNNDTVSDEYAPTGSLSLDAGEAAALAGKMSVRVYYANAAGNKLVGETVLLDYVKAYSKIDALAKAALELMKAAPHNEKLQKTLPDGASFNSVVVAGDTAVVDMNSAMFDALPSDKALASLVLASIVTTLTEFKEINYVTITCDGKEPVAANRELTYTKLTRSGALIAAEASAIYISDYIKDLANEAQSAALMDETVTLE